MLDSPANRVLFITYILQGKDQIARKSLVIPQMSSSEQIQERSNQLEPSIIPLRFIFRTHLMQGKESNNKKILVHPTNESSLERKYKKRVSNHKNLDLSTKSFLQRKFNVRKGSKMSENHPPYHRPRQYKELSQIITKSVIILNRKVGNSNKFYKFITMEFLACVSFVDSSD
jgi:hypothetical protein